MSSTPRNGLPKQIPEKRLERGPAGEAVVQEFIEGPDRYVYTDGTADFESQVDERIPMIKVAAFMSIERTQAAREAELRQDIGKTALAA